MSRSPIRSAAGTLILDSEGLSKWCSGDREIAGVIAAAQAADFRVSVSTMTPLEAIDPKEKPGRVFWYLSRLRIEPVTEETTKAAMGLLKEHDLHGHKYAIDAVVAATALAALKPAVMLTSDIDDMQRFCGEAVRIEQA